MTSTIVPALKKLCGYDKINVIDVGAARGAFMQELRNIFHPHENITSIGIDPIFEEAFDRYSVFIKGCVSNVVGVVTAQMYIHKDEQANSLSINKSDKGHIIENTMTVAILNLNDIIEEEFPTEVIHFIKIDAEGKDLDIVESLSESTLKRVKYIALECKIGEPRFEGDRNKVECIRYMDSVGFDVCYVFNADNNSQLSDVVFVNREEL